MLPLRLPSLILLTLGALAVAACDAGDPLTSRPAALAVGLCPMRPSGDTLVLDCGAAAISPFTAVDHELVVSTPRAAPDLRIIRSFSGAMTSADTLVLATSAGVGVLVRDTLSVGATLGVLRYTVSVSGTGVEPTSASVERPVADAGPPAIALASLTNAAALQPGDTLRVALSLLDDARLSETTLTLALPQPVTVTVPLERAVVDTVLDVPIPLAAWRVDSATVSVEVTDHAGATATQVIGRVGIRDDVPPTLAAQFAAGESGSYVTADTIGVNVSAGDRGGIHWVGWRLGDPAVDADSVAVAGSALDLLLAVPASRLGAGMRVLRFFARDSTGNQSQAIRPLSGGQVTYPLDILDAIRLPGTVLDGYAGTARVELDADRGHLYRQGLYTYMMDVHAWPGLALEERIFAPEGSGGLSGLQLSAGGDSLFAVMGADLRSVGVMDLTVAPRAFQIRAPASTEVPESPTAVAVSAANRAFLALARPNATYRMLDFDLATLQEQERPEVSVQPLTRLIATRDGQRIVATNVGPADAWYGQVYDSQSDSWTAAVSLGPRDFDLNRPRVADDGSVVLVGGAVFDAQLQRTHTLVNAFTEVRDAALSPDGSIAYVAVDVVGYAIHTVARVFRTSDGVLLGSIVLPRATSYLEVIDGAQGLFAAAGNAAIVLQVAAAEFHRAMPGVTPARTIPEDRTAFARPHPQR